MTATKALTADWVLPVAGAPIANGAIVADRQRIIYVGPQSQMPCCDVVQRLQKQAILPGLINAHTHLEFSNLEHPLGRPGMNFTKWIADVVAWRRNCVDKKSAIDRGIKLSVASGVAAIGEIASPPVNPSDYARPVAGAGNRKDSPECLIHVFQESLGANQNEFDEKIDQLIENASSLASIGVTPGLSPHAPYSVPQILLKRLIALTAPAACETSPSPIATRDVTIDASAEHAPNTATANLLQRVDGEMKIVAMHLAETVAEREFVEHRRGQFLEMLKQFGVWQPELFPGKGSILEILIELAQAPRSLVVHGNYLTLAELNFIATCKDRMSIVFCPRTHRYFQHVNYPIDAILDRGINLAIGTDSLASNPDLSVLNELREVRRRFAQLADATILEMGTIKGAIALGIDDRLGSLVPGKANRFCIVELEDADDPYSWLASSD